MDLGTAIPTWSDCWRLVKRAEDAGFGSAASAGPADDCIIDKIEEFENELSSKATPAPERLMALQFLLHFLGDIGSGKAARLLGHAIRREPRRSFAPLPTPAHDGKYDLDSVYVSTAAAVAAMQLSKAGVRLAFVLNKSLGP